MKTLKKIGIGVGILIVLLLFLAAFLPKEFTASVEREMVYPRQVLYNIAHDVTTQPAWNPWSASDTSMHITPGNITKGKGAYFTWTSETVAEGKQTITALSPEAEVDYELDFGGGKKGTAKMMFLEGQEKNKVRWDFSGRLGWPMNLMTPIYKYMVKKANRSGLEMMEKLAQQRWNDSNYGGFTIGTQSMSEKNYIGVRSMVDLEGVQTFYLGILPRIFQQASEAGLVITGQPCGLYYNVNDQSDKIDLAGAIPVSEDVALSGVETFNIPAGTAIVVNHYGSYETLSAAHAAAENYLSDHKMQPSFPRIEEYVSDPTQVSIDSVLTKLYVYIQE